MLASILATKLHIPPFREKVVIRSRLLAQLSAGLSGKMTLISAPAGFGKTTLISYWVSQLDRSVGWLSLDETDNDPRQFWAYFIATLQTVVPEIGDGELEILLSPQPPAMNQLLTSLINKLDSIQNQLALVLDDYHLIQSAEIDSALAFLLDHLPTNLHLVIITREDPALPLVRLRARHQLNELRAADLRFTSNEAANFLNEVMALNLSPEDISILEKRTEGWITGLQLAAISMQGHDNASQFIKSFAGSHRFVLDYLIEEVLQQQPEQVQTFLLYTCILDHLCASLCDAVLMESSGDMTLEYLERANLLIIPLDDKREWYRYHHLFRDMLRTRLRKVEPGKAPELHLRASDWYKQQDLPSDAIRHAFAAGDYERAAGLIEQTWPAMRRTRQEATISTWMKALPDELIRLSPGLSVGYAWALLDANDLEAAEARLRDADHWLNTKDEAELAKMIVADKKHFRSLPASVANARAFRAQTLGDLASVMTYTQQALELLPEDEYYERGTAAALLGLGYWASGDLEAAYQSFSDGVESLYKSGSLFIVIGGSFLLANIRMTQGRLSEAERICKDTLRLAMPPDKPILKGAAELYLGLSGISYERGNLEAAKEYLMQGRSLGESASLPGHEYYWSLTEAHIMQTEGNIDEALDLLQQAEALYYKSPVPEIWPISALIARLWLKAGRLAEARDWAHQRGLGVDDDLNFLQEYEHITLARILITQYKVEGVKNSLWQASKLLERLAAKAEKRIGSFIEISALQALIYYGEGDIQTALRLMESALKLAESQQYVQLFIEEGADMENLLEVVADHGIVANYTDQLMTAFGKIETTPLNAQNLGEPLTDRELDVLHLLGTDLSGPEIARELVIALSTVRTHTKSIYDKLNVTSRRAAIKRAIELNLI